MNRQPAWHARRSLVGASVLIALLTVSSSVRAQTLTDFLAAQGFAGAKMERRAGNHLFVRAKINQARGALVVDTGCPFSLIVRESAAKFKLVEQRTDKPLGSIFGMTSELLGTDYLKTLSLGDCTITNVPVAIASIPEMNQHRGLTRLDGILGAAEMHKFGMILDCTGKMLYISPQGPRRSTSQELAAFLSERGFTRVPMKLNSNQHFEIEGTLNGHLARMIVDTGAPLTSFDSQFGVKCGVAFSQTSFQALGAGGKRDQLSVGFAKELSIGDFKIAKPKVTFINLSSGLLQSKLPDTEKGGILGNEYLSFGVIDIGGRSLYLRHPNKR